MNTAKFVKEITVQDPDTGGDVEMEVYKHKNGGMFAIDSSYLEQVHDDDTYPIVPDPFTGAGNEPAAGLVMLINGDCG